MAYDVFLETKIEDDKVQAFLTYAGYHIRDARDPLERVMQDVVFPAIGGQLDSEGARGGSPYEELSPEYLERKIREGYGGQPILRRTGDMAGRNVGDRYGDLFADNSYRATRDSLRYAPRNRAAHWHQTGGYVAGQPPQRQILQLTVEDDHEIQDIFNLWLDELRVANARRPNAPDPDTRPSAPDFFIL